MQFRVVGVVVVQQRLEHAPVQVGSDLLVVIHRLVERPVVDLHLRAVELLQGHAEEPLDVVQQLQGGERECVRGK